MICPDRSSRMTGSLADARHHCAQGRMSTVSYSYQMDGYASEKATEVVVTISTSVSCMDLRRQRQEDARAQGNLGPRSSSALRPPPGPQGDARAQSYTSHIAPAQWENLPASFHPPRYEQSSRQREVDWSAAPSLNRKAEGIESGNRGLLRRGESTNMRRRRRPQNLNDVPTAPRALNPDPTLLYPQMSPYDDTFDPRDIAPRAISQPATPSWNIPRSSGPEPGSITLPRTPTYPPANGRRRFNTTSIVTDAAFRDEEDYRLFVEATSGLGPVPTFRESISPSPSGNDSDDEQAEGSEEYPGRRSLVSPIHESPTTMRALQYVAQMPSQDFGSRQTFANHPAGPDRWQHASRRPEYIAPIYDWQDVPDVSPVEEELPDYASSQAQAQMSRRSEAARRANELQRRWREGQGHGYDRPCQ